MTQQDWTRLEMEKLNRDARLSADDPAKHELIARMQTRIKQAILSDPERVLKAHSKISPRPEGK